MSELTAEEFQKARALCGAIRMLIKNRHDFVAARRLDSSLFSQSAIWQRQFTDLAAYCLDPTYDVVRTWRTHTWRFTGNSPYHHPLPWPGSLPGREIDNPADPAAVPLRAAYIEETRDLPDDLVVRPPRRLGETGYEINGGLFNRDVLATQSHVTTLHRSAILPALRARQHTRILEIGSGYGALAHALKLALPSATYFLLDIPESLVFAAVYLGITMPELIEEGRIYVGDNPNLLVHDEPRFTLVPDFLLCDVPADMKFDLIVNTGSFGEMTTTQVERYRDFAAAHLAPDGLLYEENQDTFLPVSALLARRLKDVRLRRLKKAWAVNDAPLRRVVAEPAPAAAARPLSGFWRSVRRLVRRSA